MPEPRFSTADVRRYYDTNTEAFVRHGQGGTQGTIHRAVWGPGVRDRAQAFRYVEDLIIREIDALDLARPARVLDLGCGVGASLTYIAQQRSIRGTGFTLSPLQVHLGNERAGALGVADCVQFVEGDYCALPEAGASADLAFAIESFVHGPSPSRFFAEAARVLRPGGLLVVCDDVRVETSDAAARRTIAQFVRGWHVNSLLTATEMQDDASRVGMRQVRTIDLTPWLELGRPRDRALAIAIAPVRWMSRLPARLAPLVGGVALQRGLARGWIAYHCAVFERT